MNQIKSFQNINRGEKEDKEEENDCRQITKERQ